MYSWYSEEKTKDLLDNAIDAIKRCKENKDFDTMLVLIGLCKAIGGEEFHAELTTD